MNILTFLNKLSINVCNIKSFQIHKLMIHKLTNLHKHTLLKLPNNYFQ